MKKMKVMVINGPGTALLGRQEIKGSGNDTLNDIDLRVREKAEDYDIKVTFVRSNYEGEIIEAIYRAHEEFDGIILNAGAYAYSSTAIADAINSVGTPVIEVSTGKEGGIFGKSSILTPFCTGKIYGLGTAVYTLALEALGELQ